MSESKGVWLDTKTGKVVTAQPEEGVQLLAPGVEASAADLAGIEAAKAAAAPEPAKAKAAAAPEKVVTAPVRK